MDECSKTLQDQTSPQDSSHSSLWVYFREDSKSRDQFAQTPESLMKFFEEKYGVFTFDPCPVDPKFDGLSVEWGERNYVNPPFKNLKAWLEKSLVEWRKGREIVFLMPVRIHTSYFLDLVQPLLERGEVDMYVLRGGVRFRGYQQRAPFGMMYLHFPAPSSNARPPTDGRRRTRPAETATTDA